MTDQATPKPSPAFDAAFLETFLQPSDLCFCDHDELDFTMQDGDTARFAKMLETVAADNQGRVSKVVSALKTSRTETSREYLSKQLRDPSFARLYMVHFTALAFGEDELQRSPARYHPFYAADNEPHYVALHGTHQNFEWYSVVDFEFAKQGHLPQLPADSVERILRMSMSPEHAGANSALIDVATMMHTPDPKDTGWYVRRSVNQVTTAVLLGELEQFVHKVMAVQVGDTVLPVAHFASRTANAFNVPSSERDETSLAGAAHLRSARGMLDELYGLCVALWAHAFECDEFWIDVPKLASDRGLYKLFEYVARLFGAFENGSSPTMPWLMLTLFFRAGEAGAAVPKSERFEDWKAGARALPRAHGRSVHGYQSLGVASAPSVSANTATTAAYTALSMPRCGCSRATSTMRSPSTGAPRPHPSCTCSRSCLPVAPSWRTASRCSARSWTTPRAGWRGRATSRHGATAIRDSCRRRRTRTSSARG